MQKIKRLLTLTIVSLTLITALLGMMLVLDVISTEDARNTIIKLFQVFGIATAAAAIVIGVLHVNK